MSDVVIYSVLALLVGVILGAVLFLKKKDAKGGDGGGGGGGRGRVAPRPRAEDEAGGAGPPNRVIANRNARARMRAAAQRHDDDSDEEEESIRDDIALPDGKVGKKKLAKLEAKADRRAMREAEEREREEKKKRQEQEAEERKKEEEREAEEEAQREEQERKEREEREKREHEEYLRMKASFEVEEEGFEEANDEDAEKNLLNEFVSYIKSEKVVVLEDLAAKFKLKAKDAIKRVEELQKEGTLTGVMDDRGKFIYISMAELEGVAKFIRQRGRVTLAELSESSASLISLTPDAAVKG